MIQSGMLSRAASTNKVWWVVLLHSLSFSPSSIDTFLLTCETKATYARANGGSWHSGASCSVMTADQRQHAYIQLIDYLLGTRDRDGNAVADAFRKLRHEQAVC